MERLTPLSAAFLEAEDVDPTASMAIGSFAVFEGPAPDFDDFVKAIEGRLPLLPRYRQKLRQVPFDIAPPAWVDDPDFDVRWHIRNTALPSPGRPAEIGRLLSRVMSRRMDRGRPLWEYWFCEGLPEGRWGLLSKIHHSLVDGVSGTDVYKLVLDPTPEPRPAIPDDWEPAPPASTLEFTARALYDLGTTPAHTVAAVGKAVRSPAKLVRSTVDSARGMLALAGSMRPGPQNSLTGALDGSRRYAWTDISMDDIRTIRQQHGVTVNDVALAAVAGGFRTLLLSRGETPDARALRSLVPVSTRAPGEESILDNRVSMMLPHLPVDLADPVERLLAVHERIGVLKASHQIEAGGSLTAAMALGPFAPVAWAMKLGLGLPQRQIATVTTNVPGPRQPLYALGREAVALLPYVPIADRVRFGVAIFSYNGTLTFGVTADYDAAPDIDVLVEGIAASVTELVGAAR